MAMPRGSIFGALLLISIGGLFLWANLDPSLRPWPLIGRYWPVLIIFWGISKLVDYLSLRGTPEAARAARLSVGDICLLILILLIGTGISRATRYSSWDEAGIRIGDEEWGEWFGNRYQFTQELSQELQLPALLTLHNPRGNVNLLARSPQPGETPRMDATIRKTLRASSADEAERLAQEFVPVLEHVAGGYELRWKKTADGARLTQADLELKVPPTMGARVETRRGDVRVGGLAGDFTLHLERGAAELIALGGNATVELRRGRLQAENIGGNLSIRGRGNEITVSDVRGEVRIDGEFTGPIQVARVAGSTRFTSRRTTFSAERLAGELRLERGDLHLRRAGGHLSLVTEDKDIYFEEVAGPLRIENRHGIIRVRLAEPPRETIEITSHSGDIDLVLPATSGFAVEARAPAGEILSDFTGPDLKRREERQGSSLVGTYGTRRATLRLNTRYGSIHLRRATGSTEQAAR